MTVLPWRSQTRARLLLELAGSFVGIGVSVTAGQQETPANEQQRIEDVRLAAPLAVYAALPRLHVYRRRLDSTVHHAQRECPAWPSAGSWDERVGMPLIGEGCRECARLGE